MSFWAYLRELVDAAYASQRATIKEANAMETFFHRNGWMFSGEEKSWVEATVSMSGWQTLGYNLLQERRDAAGSPADPGRMSLQPSAVGLGVRALMMPHRFLNPGKPPRPSQDRRHK